MKTLRQSRLQIIRAFVLLAACLLPGILLAAPLKIEPSEIQGPDFVAPTAYGQRPVNVFGAAVRDAEGNGINYSRKELAAMEAGAGTATNSVENPSDVMPQGFVPAESAEQPFWRFSISGSGIGASNIIIGPLQAGVGAREIIVGGNSAHDYGPDDFWQVIRRNSATGRYEGIFVSPIYTAILKRIAIGNVVGDARQEIAAMLANGRIHLYDLTTKEELGYIDTGVTGLEGLSLTDLDGDGSAEVIVTTVNNLLVFSGAGALLWQVAGAGGYEVVAGQMDNDPALEIATTSNKVVDAVTHTVQWTYFGALVGTHLKLAPMPGRNYQQLVVSEWSHVNGYDVAGQVRSLSIPTVHDVGGIEIADVDNDGMPEVIIGDNQFGAIHVYDLITQAQKWATNNPEHGVTGVAVGDVDNDGVVDLVWGAGWTSSGPDYLYVASTTGTHAIKWQSLDLSGPLSGPALGDLDGDGQPELVTCTGSAPGNSGRIFVFDLATLTLRGMSAPVGSNVAGPGRHDMKLYDMEGDGRMDIVVATNAGAAGFIEIYGFDSSNNFTRKWINTSPPTGLIFNFVEVADLNGNGVPEIIAGSSITSTGSPGVNVYIFDYPSTSNPWSSGSLAPSFEQITGLVVEDLDNDGGKEIAALVSTGNLYTFDGSTRTLENLVPQSGGRKISRGPVGLIKADITGVGHFLKYSSNSYYESFSHQLGAATPSGLNLLSNGELWVGVDGRLSLRLPPSYDRVEWQGPLFGTGCGRVVATAVRNGQTNVFASAQHAVAGFVYEPPLPLPTPTPTPTLTPVPTPGSRPTPTPAATP